MLKYIIIICLFLNGCTAYKHNQLQKEIIKKQQSWLNIQYLAMKKPQLTNKKGTMKKYNKNKSINLFKKLCSNNLEQDKRQEITNEIRSRMVHNKPFTINDFNSFANWYNENKKI